MIVSIQGGKPYILDGSPLGNGIIYYWNDGTGSSGLNPSGKLPIFTASGTLTALTLSDTTNGGGLAFRSDGVTIGNASQPVSIRLSQTQFANWPAPDILLSMAVYSLFNSAGTVSQVLTAPQSTAGTIPANNLIILPVIWYANCTSNGNFDQITEPAQSIQNWFCLVDPTISGCASASLLSEGFTNLPDCQDGLKYDYCPVNDTCGNNNCNGPCPSMIDDCLLNNSQQFACVLDPEKAFKDTDWWKSPYFIGGVIGLIVLILVIIFAIFMFLRRGTKTPTDKDELDKFALDLS